MRKRYNRIIAGTLAAAMVLSAGGYMSAWNVQAQQTSGNAPFINTWLVSGPFDTAVADELYGLDSSIPENIAKTAEITASSYLEVNPPSYLADGATNKQWVSDDGNDYEPWVNFRWEDPVSISSVKLYQWGDGRHVNQWYDITLTLSDGSTIESGQVDSVDRNEPTEWIPGEPVHSVVEMRVDIDKGRDPYPSITGLSEVEIFSAGTEETGRPLDGNWARSATATATSKWWDDSTAADKANDGRFDTSWISRTSPDYWEVRESEDDIYRRDPEPTLTLTWNNPIKVKEMKVYDRKDSAEGELNTEEVVCTLYDAAGNQLAQETLMDPTFDTPAVWTLDTAVEGVASAAVMIVYDGEPGRRNEGLGLSEVQVFDGEEPEEPEEPAVEITPVLGEAFGAEGGESHKWEYFDDRLYNRTYDDYQDLMGYYTVKKGMDTKNKYLYAHSYVYSPVEQKAYFNVGATGSYRMYVNDQCVSGSPTVPVANPQKDDTKVQITLKEGWNKLLIQIYHAYTEDLDSSGIPVAADAEGAYAGFYGRIADGSGNAIEGLEYSVTGETDELQIVTSGMSSDEAEENNLPDNDMPTGYKEWPYVWNKSTHDNTYGVSASAFRFMAAGGTPEYTWELVDGELPEGLHLTEDGTIADGLVDGKASLDSTEGIITMDCPTGDYSFTVEVTDAEGNKAQKEFTITVKDRPNKKFEDGKVGALTHVVPIYNLMLDPNYDIDGWAERAKGQGHSLVSIESIQQAYFWPSKFNNPDDDRHMYFPKDENGKLYDALKPFEEAVRRYGMDFGLYYGPACGPITTDSYVQDLTDLITRYDPDYIYFDGPQGMGRSGKNFDIIYSCIRNLNNDIIINANAWGSDYGDVDLRTEEASGIYAGGWSEFTVKKTVMEPWKMIRTKNAQSPYYGMRDDYRQVIREMIMNTGRGYVDNNDQTILDSRGPSRGDSIEKMAMTWPMSVQEFIDVRNLVTEWFAPEGKTERHEAMTGTTPYYLSGWGFEDDGRGNWNEFALAKNGLGPDWGYAVSRDNNIYLHIIEGPDNKKGMSAPSLEDGTMTISPVEDTVTSVMWLNEDIPLDYKQEGDSLTIRLTGVEEDQIDTIIRIQTDSVEREYVLTDLFVEGRQLSDNQVQLVPEGQMTFPALKAELEKVTYTIDDPSAGISVDENGLVTASENASGSAVVTVTGTCEGVSVSETVKMTAKNGKVCIGEELNGVTLKVSGKETYIETTTPQTLSYTLEGRSMKGGSTGMNTAEVTWHAGYVNVSEGTNYVPLALDETDDIRFENGRIIVPEVAEDTRAAVWADISLDGKTYTTNKVFIQLKPYENIMENVKVTAGGSVDGSSPEKVTDGIVFQGASFDGSKWSASGDGESWLAFDLGAVMPVEHIQINYNSDDQQYRNTPKTVEFQVSEDGENWETVQTASGPSTSSRAYFGFANEYSVSALTRYVRLLFPDGGNSSVLDILEVEIDGADTVNRLNEISAEPIQLDDKTAVYQITGYNVLGEEIDLTGASIEIESLNPDIVQVDENNRISAVSEGRAELKITVSTDKVIVSKSVYPGVDAEGNLYFPAYLAKVTVTPDKKTVSVNDPISVQIQAFDDRGRMMDMSNARIQAELGTDSLVFENNQIRAKDTIQNNELAEVKFIVTLAGITLESKSFEIVLVGNSFAVPGKIEAEDGIIEGTEVREEAGDGGTALGYITEGDVYTYVVNAEEGGEYEVYYRAVAQQMDKRVQCYVNGVLQGGTRFEETGNWTEFSTTKQEDNIVLNKGINVITLKPIGTGYLFNFNWFELKKVEEAGEPADRTALKAAIADAEAVDLDQYVDGAEKDAFVKALEDAKAVEADAKATQADVDLAAETLAGAQDALVKIAGESLRELLQKTYDYALTLTTDGAVDSAVKNFEAAKSQAKAVLDKEQASEAEVSEAWNDLLEGIWGLGIKQGDKEMLGILIDKAESMIPDKDRYVQDNWQNLVDALEAAQKVMDDGDALEEDVQPAADALLQAILEQRLKADKSNLEDLISRAESFELSRYTQESAAGLKTALAAAKAVMADESLSVDDQAKVDAAAEELDSAINGLRLASSEDGNTGDGSGDGADTGNGSGDDGSTGNGSGNAGSGDSSTSGNGSSDGNSAANGSGNGSEDGNSGNKAAKTGDNADFVLWLSVMAAAAAGTVVVRRRKIR